jgi:hypothetical protein
MSRPYSEQDLSTIFDADLIWRRKELSDIKAAIKAADSHAKPVLLRALTTMSYAHWEGYVRVCASRYFEHLTLRKKPFNAYERQIYVNSILSRLDALSRSRASLSARCDLVNDILDGAGKRFSYVNPDLAWTQTISHRIEPSSTSSCSNAEMRSRTDNKSSSTQARLTTLSLTSWL